jgi:hypothetical protein
MDRATNYSEWIDDYLDSEDYKGISQFRQFKIFPHLQSNTIKLCVREMADGTGDWRAISDWATATTIFNHQVPTPMVCLLF